MGVLGVVLVLQVQGVLQLAALELLGKVFLAVVVRIYLVEVAAALALLVLPESVELVEQVV